MRGGREVCELEYTVQGVEEEVMLLWTIEAVWASWTSPAPAWLCRPPLLSFLMNSSPIRSTVLLWGRL